MDSGTTAMARACSPKHRRMDILMTTQLAYTIAEACAAARVGRTILYELIRDGQLPARKCGRRTVVLADDLKRWIEGLPAVEPKTNK